jgi:hypothetical protein
MSIRTGLLKSWQRTVRGRDKLQNFVVIAIFPREANFIRTTQGDTRWVQFHYPKVNPKSGKVDDSRELLLSKAKLDATLEETRKRLEGVRVNEPTTFGGKFNKEEDKSTARLYREIVTSTPPDITRETRVVAVCGVQQFEAMPSKDGWIVADMMLLYALLGGTSTSQQW